MERKKRREDKRLEELPCGENVCLLNCVKRSGLWERGTVVLYALVLEIDFLTLVVLVR
jgi:hypothetical protein